MVDINHVRKAKDHLARGACLVAMAVAVFPLFSVLLYISVRGLGGLSWSFFTESPQPVGEPGGGIANALVGSAILVGIAGAVGIPLGVLAGVRLSEMGQDRVTRWVRFSADVMSGVPSIVVGIFVYSILVLTMGHFSALAGGVALGILMLPTITRTTEEILRLVPDSLREAGLALGVPRWRVILWVVLRTAAPGVVTGIMLAIARAAGETAPLLFTALGNRFLSTALDQPMGSLPVQIYTYAVSPFEEWHRQAWAAALVLLSLIILLNVAARLITHTKGSAA